MNEDKLGSRSDITMIIAIIVLESQNRAMRFSIDMHSFLAERH